MPSSFFGMHINCNGYNGTSCGSFNWPTVPIGALEKPSLQSTGRTSSLRRRLYLVDARWVCHACRRKRGRISISIWRRAALGDRRIMSSCVPSGCSGPLVEQCGTIPDNITVLEEFVTALVTRYKGNIKYYELWNEPYEPTGMGSFPPLRYGRPDDSKPITSSERSIQTPRSSRRRCLPIARLAISARLFRGGWANGGGHRQFPGLSRYY